ncbi:hypothetical protein H0H93_013601, partial [Arthromyces matolae]
MPVDPHLHDLHLALEDLRTVLIQMEFHLRLDHHRTREQLDLGLAVHLDYTLRMMDSLRLVENARDETDRNGVSASPAFIETIMEQTHCIPRLCEEVREAYRDMVE